MIIITDRGFCMSIQHRTSSAAEASETHPVWISPLQWFSLEPELQAHSLLTSSTYLG